MNILRKKDTKQICDPDSKEHARINALLICTSVRDLFDSKIESALIDQHNSYIAKGSEERTKASRMYFQKLELLDLLNDSEKHSIVRAACSSLFRVHQGFDNFYNEPPFAKNLYELTANTRILDSTKEEYVQTVVTCYVGNPYGVSHAAVPYYTKMIENFSPKEIELMLDIPYSNTIVANRIKSYSNCCKNYFQALELIDDESFTEPQRVKYEKLKKKYLK